jgi:hypothetical protein
MLRKRIRFSILLFFLPLAILLSFEEVSALRSFDGLIEEVYHCTSKCIAVSVTKKQQQYFKLNIPQTFEIPLIFNFKEKKHFGAPLSNGPPIHIKICQWLI